MTVEVDQRALTSFLQADRATSFDDCVDRCAAVSRGLAGAHRVRPVGFNRLTGTIKRLCSEGADANPISDPALVGQALHHLRSVEGALARPGEILEWLPEACVHTTSSGLRLVRAQQAYRGIPVFEAMRTVRFDRSGAVQEVIGDHVPLGDLELNPRLSASDAVLAAARHLAEELDAEGSVELRVSDRPPRHVASFPLPAAPALYEKRPFAGPILVHWALFFLPPEVRLGYFLSLNLPENGGVYDQIVAADGTDAGSVLWCRRCTAHASLGRGLVFRQGTRASEDLPPALDRYPGVRPRKPLPDEFPGFWITDRRTSGPNALSRRGRKALKGEREQGKVVFEPTDELGKDQQVLNAFYLVSYLHDFFYLLGFDEAEGNFQLENPPAVPGGGDRVEIKVFDVVLGEASMEITADGNPPRMNLGKSSDHDEKPTALDADIVTHELVHGITDRIVGGGQVLHPMGRTLQSQALDEGTCDYFALTIESHRRLGSDPAAAEHLVHAEWAGGRARRSYENLDLHFGDLREVSEPHRAGQVWAGALLAMNREIGVALGDRRHGHELGWQLVVDALKLFEVTPLSISFLAGRDHILDAFEQMRLDSPARADGTPLLPSNRQTDVEQAIHQAFLALGLGPAASGTGPGFDDVIGDPA